MTKKKQKNTGQVLIPAGHPNHPEPHEVDTAMVLARHYRCLIEFIIPVDDYMRKSADIKMFGAQWEMKSPTGYSKSTIENQFRRASKQAKNIIIDTRRTTLKDKEIEKSIIRETKKHSTIKRVIIVNKLENVVEILI